MTLLRFVFISICMLMCCRSSAEGFWTLQWRAFNKFLDRFDTIDYDTLYMSNPANKWGAGTKLEMFTSQTSFNGDTALIVEVPLKATLKLSAHYRYLSLSFSTLKFGPQRDFSFDFDMSGRVWGFDFIYDRSSKGNTPRKDNADIKKKTFDLNAYYVLQNKKFCYPATRGGDMEQRHTAGSPLFGLTYYYYNINILDTAVLSAFKIKEVVVNNGGLSAGFGINIVPGAKKRWLIHLSAMPTLTVFSKNKMVPTKDADDDDYKSTDDWFSDRVLLPVRASVVYHHNHFYSSFYSFINWSKTDYGESHSATNVDMHYSIIVGWSW